MRELTAPLREAVAAGGLSGGGVTEAALHPSQLNGLPGADDRGGAAEPRNNPGWNSLFFVVPPTTTAASWLGLPRRLHRDSLRGLCRRLRVALGSVCR